jgi:hypothetical protein
VSLRRKGRDQYSFWMQSKGNKVREVEWNRECALARKLPMKKGEKEGPRTSDVVVDIYP